MRDIFLSLIEQRENSFQENMQYPQPLWKAWLDDLKFIFDFNERNLRKIRLHTGFGFFLGSNWSTVYYESNEIRIGIKKVQDSRFIQDYVRLTEGVPDRYRISEIDKSGKAVSIEYFGKYISEDILRFQTTISNLWRLEFNSIAEIGGGYGGLAAQLLTIKNIDKYYIIDFPEILFWQYHYLKNIFPDIGISVYGQSSEKEIESSKIVLIPNFLTQFLNINVDLLINENSFCEMTEPQVLEYIGDKYIHFNLLYSNNRTRQFMNGNLRDLNLLLDTVLALRPSPGEYAAFLNKKDAPGHNQKYIFLGARGDASLLTTFPPIDVLHGIRNPRHQF